MSDTVFICSDGFKFLYVAADALVAQGSISDFPGNRQNGEEAYRIDLNNFKLLDTSEMKSKLIKWQNKFSQ
jgi:hypothetical protein